jgi:polysaccharide export outer membrane protein
MDWSTSDFDKSRFSDSSFPPLLKDLGEGLGLRFEMIRGIFKVNREQLRIVRLGGAIAGVLALLTSTLPIPTLAANGIGAYSPAQLQAFQQLSPAQQQALMQQMQGGGTQMGVPQQPPQFPPLVQPLPQPERPPTREEEGPLRARPGDTLIISITEPRLLQQQRMTSGAVQQAPRGAIQMPGEGTMQQQGAGTAQQPGMASVLPPRRGEQEDQELIPLPSYVQDLLGSRVYELDSSGVLSLRGIGSIPLAGLTEPQIASRLASEPELQGFNVDVAILPLEPIGTAALEPFGYDLFEGAPTTFAPATDVPVPADYVIGPGDTINIQLYGKENAFYELAVTRDGTVQIPEIGPRSVAGLTFEQLQKRVEKYVSEEMIGVRASVTMGPLRSIRVFVLGDARRPGSYTVSGLSTVTNALFYSGGIKPIGSLRNIQVKRNGKLIEHLDLYDLLLRGDTSDDIRLLPGDVIFIPPVGLQAGIAGDVRRPAIYELKNERTVGDLIELAGGLLPTAAKAFVQLERISPTGERTVVDINLTRQGALARNIADGDTVRVPSVLERMDQFVQLTGYVERPGSYQWRPGMRLTDLIPNVAALKPRADLNYVVIKRELPPDLLVEVLSARLSRALAEPGSSDNLEIRPRDEVIVFGLEENRADLLEPIVEQLRLQARKDDPERVVAVGGSIPFQGEYPLESGMRISDLIRAGGGLSQDAYTLEAELTRFEVIDGTKREALRKSIDLAAVERGDRSADLILDPFDALVVKRIANWRDRKIVEIRGEVVFPGKFVIEEDETLTDLIKRAGDFTERAYPQGSVFTREDLRKKEQIQLDRFRDQLRADVASLSLQQVQEDPAKAQAVSTAQNLLAQLETTRAVGRLVINLPGVMKGTAKDIVLEDGDLLIVPSNPQEVTIIGEVNFPTSQLYDPKLDRDDYINRSGGLTQKADKKQIYVIRANGEVLAASGSAWFGGKEQSILAGDTIVVPLNADKVSALYLWTSIADILSKIALTVAAFNAVGVF